MRRIVIGSLALLVALPLVWADDPAKPPGEQVKAIEADYNKAFEAWRKELKAAKTPEARKEASTKAPKVADFARRMVAVAEKHPKSPAALEAYTWVVSNVGNAAARPVRGEKPEDLRGQVLAALRRDFLTDARLGAACIALRGDDKESQSFLRDVMAKGPDKGVQGVAAVVLAQSLANQASQAKTYRAMEESNPDQFERLKETPRIKELLALDPAKLAQESEGLFKQAVGKVEQMGKDDLVKLCQSLSRTRDKAAQAFLRQVLEDSKHREAQGVACMALASQAKDHADMIPRVKELSGDRLKNYERFYGKEAVAAMKKEDPKEALREAIELFERVVKEYADIKDARGKTYGERAKAELFEIDALAVGKVAPDIVGEDLDGKAFKLSDYRGKVVLLDFWGNW